MKRYYDFHIHSALSPCGDDDMTANNIVNMAALKGLEMIALTDHNSCKNCPAAAEAAGKAGIAFFPGMELSTNEDIHVVCLFDTVEKAMEWDAFVYGRLPDTPNKPELFGRQLILDAEDQITGEEKKLLVGFADISIAEVPGLVRQYGGFCYPAHADRASFSVLSVLGFMTPDMGFDWVELHDPAQEPVLKGKKFLPADIRVVSSSDAHYLWDISEPVRQIDEDLVKGWFL